MKSVMKANEKGLNAVMHSAGLWLPSPAKRDFSCSSELN